MSNKSHIRFCVTFTVKLKEKSEAIAIKGDDGFIIHERNTDGLRSDYKNFEEF